MKSIRAFIRSFFVTFDSEIKLSHDFMKKYARGTVFMDINAQFVSQMDTEEGMKFIIICTY